LKVALDVIVHHLGHGLLVLLLSVLLHAVVGGLTWSRKYQSCVVPTKLAPVGLECEFLPCFEFGNLTKEFDGYGFFLEKRGWKR
jgi:hypothetical protein